jgi:hydroxymethylpyrimidine/phosphomethylpyrimidine kinase
MRRQVAALTIAGLDPSGGAGIAADLRGFAAAGVWGCSACAAITVQSTRGVRGVHAVPAALVLEQANEILDDVPVRAIKTGALGSPATVRAVAGLLLEHRRIPSVVDPVMVPSRGPSAARLDGGAATSALLELARAATLLTPNALEAGALLGRAIRSSDDARDAATALVALGVRAVLVKGGHVDGERVVDWLATRRSVVGLGRRRLHLAPVHGAGCTLAALIAGRLAVLGAPRAPDHDALLAAIRWARERHGRALRSARVVGGGMRLLAPAPAPASEGARMRRAGATSKRRVREP